MESSLLARLLAWATAAFAAAFAVVTAATFGNSVDCCECYENSKCE